MNDVDCNFSVAQKLRHEGKADILSIFVCVKFLRKRLVQVNVLALILTVSVVDHDFLADYVDYFYFVEESRV